MEEKTFEEKKQEVLAPIFITKEEALKAREEHISHKEKEFKHIEIILKQLKEKTDSSDIIISDLFREYESKNPCSMETKNYNTGLWEYVSSESLKRFSSAYENYRKIEEKKTKAIKRYRDKVNEYQGKLDTELSKIQTNDDFCVNPVEGDENG